MSPSSLSSSQTESVRELVASELREQLPDTLREQVVTIKESHFSSGPLPPVEQTESYERIHPGFVDRSLNIAEREQEKRHQHIRRNHWFEFFDKLFAKFISFAVVSLLVGSGLFLIYVDKTLEGAVAALFGALLPFASKYLDILLGKKRPKDDD